MLKQLAFLEGRENREEFYIRSLLPIKCRLDVDYVMRRGMVMDCNVLARTAWLIIWCASKKVLGIAEEPDTIPALATRAERTAT